MVSSSRNNIEKILESSPGGAEEPFFLLEKEYQLRNLSHCPSNQSHSLKKRILSTLTPPAPSMECVRI